MLYISNQQDSKNIKDLISLINLKLRQLNLLQKLPRGYFIVVIYTVNSFLNLSNIGNNGSIGLCLAKLISEYYGTIMAQKRFMFIFLWIKEHFKQPKQ
ncbi:hypothetical protein [Spiroplasma endosymbiont of Polydrusus formosus]|uniref:hypothetical protein n=1 Tax=Spiroplasma endosymbiont of Polydrusus formosus TaxID=3139326 RepID=UPI0035B51792